MFWTVQNIRRILFDLVQKVQSQSPKINNQATLAGIDFYNDYGLNSMQLVELASYVNSFFHFLDVDQAPNLLNNPSIDSWVQKILAVRLESDEYVSFQSSGTSGNSKLVSHSVESINSEVAFLKSILKKPNRILSFVPSNHIYGFLFTVVLPQIWNIPVVKVSQLEKLFFQNDDLIIATPFNWQFVYSSFNNKEIRCAGISSGSPLNDTLYMRLEKMGITITEIFGSTETGGVGYRSTSKNPFSLFSYWSFMEDGRSILRLYDQKKYQLMDHIILEDGTYFKIKSRIDHVIQIGGINVSLDTVQEKIQSIQAVKTATVFAKANESGILIGATIVLIKNEDAERASCIQEIYKILEPIEVPNNIIFLD